MPASYGIETGTTEGAVSWGGVTRRLTEARNYWLVTVRGDGRPHAAPVWGLWLDGAFYFSTDPGSQKGRNLARRPDVVMHLESGDDVVILEGRAQPVTDAAALGRYADAYEAKYDVRPEADPQATNVYAVRPQTAFAWREQDFPRSATRWRFEG